MSNADYNKMISTINSISQDYTYSPPSNNLICIDTSNNRIGINTLDPSYSLHISGGEIYATTITADTIYADSSELLIGGGNNDIYVTNINTTIINVANNVSITGGTIKVANIDVSNILDISRGQIKANYIQTNKIDVSETLDIGRGLIKAYYMQTNNIDVSGTLDISKGYIKVNNVDISGTLNISKGYIKANNIDVSGTLDNSRGLFIANNIRTQSNVEISGNIIFNVSGGNITNVNKLSAPLTNYSIVSSSRVYQDISNDISWAAVNGYYGLAKDAYPALNPYSSGAKAVQTWTSRTTITNDSCEWKSICWSPELRMFAAVGFATSNNIMTSKDGINWIVQTNSSSVWFSICWSPEIRIFVAVGNHNILTYSSQTENWTAYSNSGNWNAVCWSAQLGIFVAVGTINGSTNGYVITSTTGTGTWSGPYSVLSGNWSCICWSAELRLFVALAYSGTNRLMVSSNGVTWSLPNQNVVNQSILTNKWTSVCWSKELGLFVAVASEGTYKVITSYDGKNWTTINVTNSNFWNSVCWSSDLRLFLAVASQFTQLTPPTVQLLSINVGNADVRFGFSIDFASTQNVAVIGLPYSNGTYGTDRNAGQIFVNDLNSPYSNSPIGLPMPDNVFESELGQGVAISDDGTIIVAMRGGSGKAELLVWRRTSVLLNSYTFSYAVTISQTGNTLNRATVRMSDPILAQQSRPMVIIGIPNGTIGGIVHLYLIGSSTLSLINAYSGPAYYGSSVAISANASYAVVGQPSQPGLVYVYFYQNNTYTSILTYTGTGFTTDNLGWSVAISGDGNVIVAGSPNANSFLGRVAVFIRNGATFTLQQSITGLVANEQFGYSLSLSNNGNTLIVGTGTASIDAYVFIRTSNTVLFTRQTFITQSSTLTGGKNVVINRTGTQFLISDAPTSNNISYVLLMSINFPISDSIMYSPNGVNWTTTSNAIGYNNLNSICWSPELGIAAAVSSLGNNRVMTSSLQGRPPTSTNVFDNSFNAIDENGNWTVKQLTVSDLSSVNISNFINSLITRINYLETYASFSQPDVTFTNRSSIVIPIDLSNNSSVEINAQFSFFGWSGYSNGEQRDTRLWSEYYDTSGNLRQWLTYNMDGYHQAREVNGSYFKNGESITKGQLMWYMSTDNFFGRAHTLKITLYRLIDKFNDGRFHNFEGTSMWSWSLGTISHYHVKFAGTFEYTPQSIAFYVADHNKLNLPPYETSFNIVYNLVNKRRTL